MTRALAFVFAINILLGQLYAQQRASSSWQDVKALTNGVEIEVYRNGGSPLSGSLQTVSDDSITVLTKKQDVVIPRADVTRILGRHEGHAKWIGLAIGAGAGAGAGALISTRLASSSAGDINLKAAGTAIAAVAGALIGLAVGGLLDSRHATIYIAK